MIFANFIPFVSSLVFAVNLGPERGINRRAPGIKDSKVMHNKAILGEEDDLCILKQLTTDLQRLWSAPQETRNRPRSRQAGYVSV